MTRLKSLDLLALGFMTFALFLGAGNIIFPPSAGMAAGDNLGQAAFGFLLTGVGLPLLTVVALARVGGGMPALTVPIGKVAGIALAVAVYLAIGPLFATPRTAVVSFEIGIVPFTGQDPLVMFIYTLVYFAAVVLTWFVSAKVLLALYSVRWTPEEADFFRTTRLAWLLTFLFRASILYLLSFLLGRPLPAALAGIGISLLLRWLKSAVPAIPIRIVPPGPYPNGPTWDPGADLTAVVKGNWIALGVCILSVLIAWLCFRKRSLE